MKSRSGNSPEKRQDRVQDALAPYFNRFALAGLVFVCVILTIGESTRIAMIVGPL